MVSAEERSGEGGGRTASSGGDSCCGSAVAAPAKEERIVNNHQLGANHLLLQMMFHHYQVVALEEEVRRWRAGRRAKQGAPGGRAAQAGWKRQAVSDLDLIFANLILFQRDELISTWRGCPWHKSVSRL